ncbi:putative DNA-binding protein YlxM (UPF0122 family) [Clostridium saccharoperbutylacetonicum]|jgi:hypothetical protein|uniref:DUF1836 domain-containing protein n=1 Tax=Clostridium saccharoperbutylacetonicum N1-4(HMT) TaxID=931276 RepID=M1MFW6_9CLOT|nr:MULTISPECIES: DUF1836 domain-containing protein [Clostridium]AGF53871.1 hypothetical protein Cspa_c00360 [Clostridium saccharoperbutylacetonicum N1-4(HMT)]NRT59616.1 putative DNA-binding protein YlxM (UPF0122 family) [Clostridium saccharoperbutylacetonicum]NSB28808.1 putative DNA-binding protein YlxM (UPF0122 family) [Clostridium saccharoperbutylacetonicum]NSB42299.1 putative DNA-binding protein YlxM (UPF0122 family) [Clostridium saccharoperbutylacetonicum]
MSDFSIDNYINSQKSSNNINLDDFPEIDLYMDQVMQLFENKLSYTKRYKDDKVLTKTMINNYAKGKLLMKIKNKKYTKNHLILMGLIYNLKGSLSLTDIKTILTPIINSFDKENDYPLYDIYQSFLDIYDFNLDELNVSSNKIYENIEKLVDSKNLDLGDFEEKFLLICAYVSMSNLYRRMSEKIIDDFFGDHDNSK